MGRPLRVGIDATSVGIAGGQRTGVYQYIVQLIRELAAADDAPQLQLLFALPHYRHTETITQFMATLANRDVGWRRSPLPERYLRKFHVPADWFMRPLDVFHSPANLGLHCRSCPVVVTVHDLAFRRDRGGSRAPDELDAEERRQWDVRRAFFAEIADRTETSLRDACLIIVPSTATGDEVAETFGIGRGKIRVVHLGVRSDLMPAKEDERALVADAHRLPGPYWLFLGVIDPNKNLVTMLEGFALYHRRGGAATLAIAGQSVFYGKVLQRVAQALGIAEHVRFLGHVPDAHLGALYSGALGVLMPSPLEGFGLPALEAMACGTPVIAARGGALPEVVGAAGMFVRPEEAEGFAEAMHVLETDGSLRQSLIVAGRARAAEFSWARVARETLAVYTDATGRA